jgi:CHAT domain-containing protein
MRGDKPKNGDLGGWINAYNINYSPDWRLYWHEWQAAIVGLGPELWRLFAGRLDAELKALGFTPNARLIWLPAGALGILPLALAQDPHDKRYFVDNYEIVYAPSLEALFASHAQISKVANPSLAAVVNPTEDLPATENEGAIVSSFFPANARTILAKDAATPSAVLRALQGRTHWHFASHGTFSWGNARESALLMHGQAPLSVGRLLESGGLGRPRLVVLSACESGLYGIDHNPDEFIGLPGAFTTLGAAGVLGSLWPVQDDATALLISKFYQFHIAEALPPATALRQAQAWLRSATKEDLLGFTAGAVAQGRLETRHLRELEQALAGNSSRSLIRALTDGSPQNSKTIEIKPQARPYEHPYFWAAFVLTGL